MKNEKFCFSKGTGLIALVGIVLVAAALLMGGLSSTSTSTSTRARQGIAIPSEAYIYNNIVGVADKLMKSNPSDEVLKTKRNLANDSFMNLRGQGPLSTGIGASKSVNNRQVENLVTYTGGAKRIYDATVKNIPDRKPLEDKEYQAKLKYYKAQYEYIYKVLMLASDFSAKILPEKPLPAVGIDASAADSRKMRPVKPAASLAVVSDFITPSTGYGSDNAVISINIRLAKTRAAFEDLYTYITSTFGIDFITQLNIVKPPVVAVEPGVTPIVIPTVALIVSTEPDVEIVPVAVGSTEQQEYPWCFRENGTKIFSPCSVAVDECDKTNIDKLTAQLTNTGVVSGRYFASNDKNGKRACYELFAQPFKSGAAGYTCKDKQCVFCGHKEVPVVQCAGIPVSCGANDAAALAKISSDYSNATTDKAKRDAVHALTTYFSSASTQTRDSNMGNCYKKNGQAYGLAENASYTLQPVGYCVNQQLGTEYDGVCACMGFERSLTVARKNTTCDDAMKLIAQ